MATRVGACTRTAIAVACWLALTALIAPGPATAGALGGTAARPVSFVPDWDGSRDTTRIRVRTNDPATISVVVRARDGRVLRVLANGLAVPTGRTDLWWDGRDGGGAVVAPGRYTVAVSAIARSRRAARERRELAVRVRSPRVSVHGLQLVRGYVSAVAGRRSTSASFQLGARGLVSAAIAQANGTVVRNLLRGSRRGGRARVAWDGRGDLGGRVRDGSYLLLVSATAGQMPSATLRAPLLVDTVRPRLVSTRRVVQAGLRNGRVLAVLRLHASEQGQLVVRARSGRRYQVHVRAGRRSIALPAAQLGIRAGTRPAAWRLRLVLSDAAANASGARVVVQVPARPHSSSPAPPTPPVTTPGGALSWPVAGPMTSPFGPRWGRMHQGIDIGAALGAPISAAAGGIVSFAGTQGGYGNIVVIEHPGGLATAYAHQSRIVAVVGQVVSRGQLVGYVGSTGHSTGPHLHFETRIGGLAVDPMRYLP